jgi:hypothetical protein
MIARAWDFLMVLATKVGVLHKRSAFHGPVKRYGFDRAYWTQDLLVNPTEPCC